MGCRAQRLRRGEILTGLAALVLIVDLFGLAWFRLDVDRFAIASASGWHALSVLRWVILLAALSGLGLFWAQATRAAPALPASLSVITMALGFLTAVALVWRVGFDAPDPAAVFTGMRGLNINFLTNTPAPLSLGVHQGAGAWIGLVAGLALFAGAVWSLREEDGPDPARSAAIPIVALPE